jgi:predicted amidohydrolase
MNSPLGQSDHIWRQIDHYVAAAAEARADLVLFPELVIHGHCAPDTWDRAETVPEGASTARLEALAREHQIFISAGLSEKSQDVVFNTQIIVGPKGFVGKQRKLHTSRDETLLYKGGKDLPVFDIGKAKVATVICYDNELPEVPRLAALKGAEVILMPHAGRASQWSDDAESQRRARRLVFDNYGLYRLRAKENACFCVVTDQAGRAGTVSSLPPEHENQPHHPGGAMILAPNGKILAHTQTEEIRDEMIVSDLEASLFNEARSHPNFTLRTRRPELFAALASDHLH